MKKTKNQRYEEKQRSSGLRQFKRWLPSDLFKKVDKYIKRLIKQVK